MHLIYPLCSSSKGNAVYIGTPQAGVLLDCGIGIRNLCNALKLQNIPLSAIQAVFVTHEHSDHMKGLAKLGEQIPLTIYGNVPTLRELIAKAAIAPKTKLKEIDRKPTVVGGIEIRAFRTSHDSVDSMGYHCTFESGERFCLATDLGYVSEEVDRNLSDSDLVLIESNYDPELLMNGGYPAFLKERIQGSRGHLSNPDCAAQLCRLAERGVTQFLLGHLSEENNRPEVAMATAVAALSQKGLRLDADYRLSVAPKMTIGKAVTLSC